MHAEVGPVLIFLLNIDQPLILLSILQVGVCLLKLAIAHLILQFKGAVWSGSDYGVNLLLAGGVDDNGWV